MFEFGLILANTKRSEIYLKYLQKYKIYPKYVLFYSNDKMSKNLHKLFKKNKLETKIIKSNNINSKKIEKTLSKLNLKNFLYSGYPGALIKNLRILRLYKIFHSHCGDLPKYKGSTTLYYSILNRDKIICSTIILNHKIDEGKIVYKKNYPYPKKNKIDEYDYIIRIKNFIFYIKSKKNIVFKKTKNKNFFFKIHPILRNIANSTLT